MSNNSEQSGGASSGGQRSGRRRGGRGGARTDGANQPPRGGQPGRGGAPPQRQQGRRPDGAGGAPRADGPERTVSGFLELTTGGAGKLRDGALARRDDATVPVKLIRDLGLRPGDLVAGVARGDVLATVTSVNGHAAEGLASRPAFDRLTAVHPDTQLVLGPTRESITGRVLDLVAPVGRGQRGLIVAPPKAGKTTLLCQIGAGVAADPELTLIACLVGERPEEVTEIRRSMDGLVLAADLDMPSVDHTRVAMLGVEHAKRLVEEGRHVVVLIDSLTRLARAYNLSGKGGGRTLSGGMDASALQPVRQIFGAARQTEEAGSLTILATCLVDTGSRLDDLVYEEFKGTGNMEVWLDRDLANRRLFPAVNIEKSGTRREELLLDAQTLATVTSLRRKLAGVPPDRALAALLTALQKQVWEDGTEAPAPSHH